MFKSVIHITLLALFVFGLVRPAFSQTVSGRPSITFDFRLEQDSKTSCGIYNDEGSLIRTLWSSTAFTKGIHKESWDGKDDAGNYVNNGSYRVKVLSNNVQYIWEGIIGNTSINTSGPTVHHPTQPYTNMCFVGKTCYPAAGYNETGDAHYKFNSREPNVVTKDLLGDGIVARFVCTDGNRVYYAGQSEEYETTFITGLIPGSPDVPAVFSNGSKLHVHKFDYSAFDVSKSQISGLAVQSSGRFLFSSHQSDNQIKIFEKTTGAFIGGSNLTAPGQMAFDDVNETLWVISGKNNVSSFKIHDNGSLEPTGIYLAGISEALDLAVSPNGRKVAVADRSNFHQVRFFESKTGTLINIFGRSESYANPQVYDDKFYFKETKIFEETDYGAAHAFVEFEADGSIWVGDYGNRRSQHFSSTLAYIDNIQFMGYSYSCQADMNDPTRVFSDFLEFKIDYSKPLSATNNSWTFVRNWSENLSSKIGSDATRMHSVITLKNHRTYALYNQPGAMELIELVPESGARRTGIRLDHFRADLNSDGSQWQGGDNQLGKQSFYTKRELTGFDNLNNPIWGAPIVMDETPKVQNLDPLTADGYTNRNQVASSGLIFTFCRDTRSGWHVGGIKDGKWIFKGAPSTHINYRGAFPKDAYEIGNYSQYTGTFSQAIGNNFFFGEHCEGWKGGQVNKYKHFSEYGLQIGEFGATAEDGKNMRIEAFPGMAGNALSGTYVQVGEDIYLYHCDEGQHAGIHRWKITGLNTVTIDSTVIRKNDNPGVIDLPFTNLMEGLPFDNVVVNGMKGWTRIPAEETVNGYTKTWSVTTNRSTFKKTESDVSILSYPATDGETQSVFRELGSNRNLNNWKITGQISYPEPSEPGQNYFDVLDENDRIIVRIDGPGDYPRNRILVNGTAILSGDDIQPMLSNLQNLTIKAEQNELKITYGNFPSITVNNFDSLSNSSSPKNLRVQFFSNNRRGHALNLANLRFYKNLSEETYYRSKESGIWHSAATWEQSTDSINWSAAVSLPDTSTKSIVVLNGHHIQLDKSLVVDQLEISGGGILSVAPAVTLVLNDGVGDDIIIHPAGQLILLANASGTADIGASSGTISGNVTVEKFIRTLTNGNFKLLSSTVNTYGSNKPSIRDNWQEGQNNQIVNENCNTAPGYGIHITGSISGSNGFDVSNASLTSLFIIDSSAAFSSSSWVKAPNTDHTYLNSRQGYMVYIQGDRSVNITDSTSISNTTLRATGSLSTGTQLFTDLAGNGAFSLITNPYASHISWKKMLNDASTKNGVDFEHYVTYWDEDLGSKGGYVTISQSGLKSATSNKDVLSEAGSAFFVKSKTSRNSPTFTIHETHKSDRNDTGNIVSTNPAQFQISLFSANNKNRYLADGIIAVFDQSFSKGLDNDDAEEIPNPGENIAFTSENKKLSITSHPEVHAPDTLKLHLERLLTQKYDLVFQPQAFTNIEFQPYLIDNYLHSHSPLSYEKTTTVTFTVDNNPNSSAEDRFQILFLQASTLPVTFVAVSAIRKENAVTVRWTIEEESEIEMYEIESSSDGRNFATVGAIKSILNNGNAGGRTVYSWVDNQSTNVNIFYRIKAIQKSGSLKYSNIAKTNSQQNKAQLDIYPNPVQGDNLNLLFEDLPKGQYTISTLNNLGMLISSKKIMHEGGQAKYQVATLNSVSSQIYNVQVTGNGLLLTRQILH